ncbi:GNAT family N-acetyltransferase [Saccharothrix coeruleofusca]|uniref:N-acetyltransferase n=1 Tax=Saccharothrix coeruleofusca TaxID=33919 RepID=A0A918ANV1_9PSEU|nr:GNAT family N-acetyltransferase [Saccharothrix coeruleofusca]MBP2337606.1 RimJ/RimL family protein N-acetyltransferase [Saccharothrix coeruleofusca]GGP64714.1 N-acetyltransferase [Saccharothrix coeruleofusca]
MAKPDYPIRTERLLLRPFTPADHAALHSWQSRPDVVRYLYGGPRTHEQTAESLALKCSVTWPSEEGQHLALALQRGDEVIGETVLKWHSREHRQGEIGYILHPDHHGRGYATEASRAMLRLAFENLGLHRVTASCDARNEASWRVMERLGMRREAHFRHNEWFKGGWGDEMIYAMLEDEWPG